MAFSTNNSSISKLFILQASVTHGCYNSTLNILQAILQHGFVLQLHGCNSNVNNTVYTITACNIEYLYQYFSHHQFHLDSYQKYDLQDFLLMTGKLVHLSLLFPPKPCNFILLGVFIHCEFHTERTQPFLNCT